MKKTFFIISFLLLSSIALADMPRYITVQGRLTYANGDIASGSYTFMFTIYNETSYPLWFEVQSNINVDNKGIFTVELGRNSTPPGVNLPFDKKYFLEVRVNNQTLSPWIDITSSGYAFSAGRLLPTNFSILPGNDSTYDIGGSGQRWKDLYLGGNYPGYNGNIYDVFRIRSPTNQDMWLGLTNSSRQIGVYDYGNNREVWNYNGTIGALNVSVPITINGTAAIKSCPSCDALLRLNGSEILSTQISMHSYIPEGSAANAIFFYHWEHPVWYIGEAEPSKQAGESNFFIDSGRGGSLVIAPDGKITATTAPTFLVPPDSQPTLTLASIDETRIRFDYGGLLASGTPANASYIEWPDWTKALDWKLGQESGTGDFVIKNGGGPLFKVQNSTGNIGIGTGTPSEELTVYSPPATDSFIRVSSTDGKVSGIKFGEDQNSVQTWGHRIIYNGTFPDTVRFQNVRNTVPIDVMTFAPEGNVKFFSWVDITNNSADHISGVDSPFYFMKDAYVGTPTVPAPSDLAASLNVWNGSLDLYTYYNDSRGKRITFSLGWSKLPGTVMTIYNDNAVGKVGIGTETPAYKLDVAGDANAQRLCIGGDCRNAWPSGGGGGGAPGGSDGQVQYNNGGSFGGASSLYYDDTNNRVGIKTTIPQMPLEVNGAVKIAGDGNEACNSNTEGTLRYYVNCVGTTYTSHLEACMQSGTTSWTWFTIKTYTLSTSACPR